MTFEETVKLLALIKLAYPNSYKDIDKETQLATVNMWQRAFDSTPSPIVELALDHYVRVSKFPPTIADIYEELKRIHGEAMQNVLLLEDGKQRELNYCIMKQTEKFKENGKRININTSNFLLNGVELPSLEG